MAPIPIALCGKHPDMCDGFIAGMQPEYNVVHVCHSAPAAISELVPLLKGERLEPASGKGTNVTANPQHMVPKAIVVGGGFEQGELEEMRAAPGMDKLPWLYPSALKLAAAKKPGGTGGPPPIEMIVARAKEALKQHEFVEGKEDEVVPGLWEF